ncbi:AP-4 complex subunit beta-1-like [Amphiura filiformis]|uniref:AP-4 complex subunit beta-1-like n=1 Tax=Amphiura filiformis TaxID=82378 RepID=UPI003B223D5A
MACLMSCLDEDDIKEIRNSLGSPEAQTEPGYLRDVLNKIIVQMTRGTDMAPLFMDMVKVCATTDIVQKKLVYLYMSNYSATKPDLAVLTVNTLCKDCQDSNPMIRGLALKTLCSLRLSGLVEYIEKPLLTGLKDYSAYVRRAAVLGCVKIHQMNPQFIANHGLIDQLYDMLRDSDVIVVTNCLGALEELLADKGGVVINQRLAHFLVNRLTNLTEWGQCFVLQTLLKYTPDNEDEVFDIMNVIDLYVKHTNSGVSMAAITLMIHLTQDLSSIGQDVYRRIKGPLLILLSSEHPELVYSSLCHIQWVKRKMPKLFSKYYKKFYCRSKDPTYVKYKKIELLGEMIKEDTLPDIVEELSVCCTDISSQLAQQAIQTLCLIAKKGATYATPCIAALLGLLNLQLDYVSSEVLVAFQDLLSYESNKEYIPHVLSQLGACETIVQSSRGKAALIWLLGHYGESLPDAPYILENMIDVIEEETSAQVKLHLLTATTKLFFTRPAECQDMMGKLLEFAIESDTNVEVRERAQFYYRMLNTDVNKAKEVVCASQTPDISDDCLTETNKLDNLANFNSLSILFGPLKWSQIQLKQTDTKAMHQIPSPTHSSVLATPTREDHSATPSVKPMDGQLVDIDESKDAESMSVLQLVGDILVTPEEYESTWTMLSVYDTIELPLLEPLEPKQIHSLLENTGCKVMATTPEEFEPWRAFVYAKDTTDTLYLVEVVLQSQTDILTFTLKVKGQTSSDRGGMFAQQLQKAFS